MSYLCVVTGGFVLELPRLICLVLSKFKCFALEYAIFAIFKPWVLMLGFPACVLLTIVAFKCGVSCVWWWVTLYIAFVLLNPLTCSLPSHLLCM